MGVRRDSPNTKVYLSVSPGKKISATVPGDATPPAIRYNDTTSKWQASNDGIAFFDIGSGGGGFSGSFIKISETILTQIPAETSHTLPGGYAYTQASGSMLDVYLNGQLLSHDDGTHTRDYMEVTSTTIKFYFIVLKDSTVTYIIK